jgi:hypothetical protein
MAIYATWDYYTQQYYGTAVAQASWDYMANRAGVFLDAISDRRIAAVIEADEDADMIDKIKQAACAVVEELAKIESAGGIVTSERVGQYAVTYAEAETRTSQQSRLARAARLHLHDTDLLYRGVE